MFPGHFRVTSPAFHWQLADLIFSDHPRVCIAAPRGHAKSTLTSLVCLLYGAAHERFRYCMLISDTSGQAELFLEDVRREVETNERLRETYPGLRPGRPWSERELRFASGAFIQAAGAGVRLRGRKSGGMRPDLVLVDDLENDELVASYERRLKLRRWFRATLLPMMDPSGRIRVVGTVLHTDSLLSRLLRTPEWHRRRWSALSDDGRSALWPAWKPVERLLAEKEEARRDGLLSVWYQEYQNVAIADEESPFRPDDITYFDGSIPPDENGELQPLYKSLYVDPAISEKDKADWTGYTAVYATHAGIWYVVEAFRSRDDPATIIETVQRLHRKHKFDTIGVEAVQYQKALAFWLQRSDAEFLPVEAVTPDTDKRRRIMALQPYFRRHRILLSDRLPGRLEAELLNLDSTDHDDLADSLAGHLFVTIAPEPPKMRERVWTDSADERAYKHRRETERRARLRRHGIR